MVEIRLLYFENDNVDLIPAITKMKWYNNSYINYF